MKVPRPRPKLAGQDGPRGKMADAVKAKVRAMGYGDTAGAIPEPLKRNKLKAFRDSVARKKVALDTLAYRRTEGGHR